MNYQDVSGQLAGSVQLSQTKPDSYLCISGSRVSNLLAELNCQSYWGIFNLSRLTDDPGNGLKVVPFCSMSLDRTSEPITMISSIYLGT